MALIKCPECGKEISDKAVACIHCGCPLQQGTNTMHTSVEHTTATVYPQEKNIRMNKKEVVTVITLVAISLLLPLALSRGGIYNFRLISFIWSAIPCVAIALLAVFQPKKKELLCAAALTFNALASFVVPQFLYREPLTIIGLLSYLVFFSLIVIYWLSAAPVIGNRAVPIIATIGYGVFCLVMVFVASTYGRYRMTVELISNICELAFYSSCCIIICNSMKLRLQRVTSPRSASGQYMYVQDAPSTGFAILCFCFPIVGLILYCVWRETLPQRAKSAGVGGLLGFVIGLVLVVILYGILLA